MRQFTILLLATTLCLSAFGQNSVSGLITLGDSITSVSGVHVYLKDTPYATTTNASGQFRLEGVPDGRYTLAINNIGFLTQMQEVALNNQANVQMRIVLKESIELLDEVAIITKGSNSLKGIPGSVQYISPKEIARFSYTDPMRTLRLAPGVNMREEDGFGLRPNIGLRGTGVERSAKITLMEDGILAAPAPYADPSAYYFPSMGRMYGVEILKGSSQIKYGPYTTGGAINFISTPIPQYLSAHVSMMAGNFGTRNVHAFAGDAHERVSYLFETFQFGSNGFKELDNGGNTGFTKADYIGKLKFTSADDARVNQSVLIKAGQSSEQSNETYLGLTEADFEATPYRRYAASQLDNMQSKQQQYSVTHYIDLSKQFNLTTTGYYTQFNRNWYKLNNVTDSSGNKYTLASVLEDPTAYQDAYSILTGSSSVLSNALTMRANNREYHAQGVQSQLAYQAIRGAWKHDAVIGVRVHSDGVDRFQWDDTYAMVDGSMSLTTAGEPGTESNRVRTANALAAYMQYQLTYGAFTFVPGIRYENIAMQEDDYGKTDPDRTGTALVTTENNVAAFIPGIGIDYMLNKSMHIFGGVHKGFGPPGVTPDTDPESSINYELGMRYGAGASLLHATAFMNDYSNLLGTDMTSTGGAGTGDQFNAGSVRTVGIELQAGYDLAGNSAAQTLSIPVAIAYTFTHAEFTTSFDATYEDWGEVVNGDIFPYQAAHQINGMIGCTIKKCSGNINVNYLSAMRTTPGSGDIPEDELIPARTVVDGSLGYQVNHNWTFFGTVMNVLDAVYLVSDRPAGFRPGLPRSFNAGIKMNF